MIDLWILVGLGVAALWLLIGFLTQSAGGTLFGDIDKVVNNIINKFKGVQ